jgi:hypothetical protein
MTYRQFWATILVVGVVTVGRHVVGPEFAAAYFMVLGAFGLVATLYYAHWKRRLARRLSEWDPNAQDRALVAMEAVSFRPELAEALGRTQPRVPLRGTRERFTYPPEAARTTRWVMRAGLSLSGFFALGWLSDVVLGRTRFVGPDTPRFEIAGLIAAFGAMGLMMWWMARESAGVLEVTDEDLTWRVPGRAPKRIRWADVTEVRHGELSRRLVVRAGRRQIAVSDVLVGYGRVINLVATRLPVSARWRAS